MALTLVATPRAADANTYATLDEADTYHEGHLYATSWTGATDDTKKAALVMATRLLDYHMAWDGWKKDLETQRLAWPRQGLVTPEGENVDDSTIPEFLKEATAEFARWLIDSDRTAEGGYEGIKYLQVDVIKLVPGGPFARKLIPPVVMEMIRDYGRKKRRARRLVRC